MSGFPGSLAIGVKGVRVPGLRFQVSVHVSQGLRVSGVHVSGFQSLLVSGYRSPGLRSRVKV